MFLHQTACSHSSPRALQNSGSTPLTLTASVSGVSFGSALANSFGKLRPKGVKISPALQTTGTMGR